jgi:hypothetical protein
MTRGLDAATIAALGTDGFELALLLQLDFPTVQRLTTWNRDVSALSTTFVSSPHVISLDSPQETTEVRVNELSLEFSGVDQTYISILLNTDYINTRVRVWYTVMENEAVVGQPIVAFDGQINDMKLTDGDGQSAVTITASNHWKDFEKTMGRRTNPASQNEFYPLDKGMEFSQDLQKEVAWGRK